MWALWETAFWAVFQGSGGRVLCVHGSGSVHARGASLLQRGREKALAVEDRELIHRWPPRWRRARPCRTDVAQRQPDEFGRRVIVRKMPTGLDDLADARIEAFECVRRVDHAANVWRKRKERNHPRPGAAPRRDDRGEALAPLPVRECVQGVGREIGARAPGEQQAVLVQAVISRTYAVAHRGRWESLGFDAFADVRDQVYLGVGAETAQVWDAVHATTGEVVRYRGATIEAFFHSTCGSSTAAVEEAFRFAQPRPYLRAVSDAKPGGGAYCDPSPRFRWREEWDAAGLRAILTRTLPSVMPSGGDGLQRITDAEVTRTTRSGRVAELRIAFERGDARIAGSDVRRVLRPSADRELLSTAFQLHVTRENGTLTRLVACGAGAGPGGVLCQGGAIGRARAGESYGAGVTGS